MELYLYSESNAIDRWKQRKLKREINRRTLWTKIKRKDLRQGNNENSKKSMVSIASNVIRIGISLIENGKAKSWLLSDKLILASPC